MKNLRLIRDKYRDVFLFCAVSRAAIDLLRRRRDVLADDVGHAAILAHASRGNVKRTGADHRATTSQFRPATRGSLYRRRRSRHVEGDAHT